MVSSPAIPSLPPIVFVPLIPLASNSPYYSPASLKFSCPVNVVASSTWDIRTGRPQNSSVADAVEKAGRASHVLRGDGGDTITLEGVGAGGYVCVGENCPVGTSVRVASEDVEDSHTTPVSEGLFSRALRVPRSHAPTHTNSFSPSLLPKGPLPAREENAGPHHHMHCSQAIPGQVPLLIFHDTTPVLSVRSSTGVFEIHLDEVDKLGVDLGFWIAICAGLWRIPRREGGEFKSSALY
ncbi:hypothetical protein BGW80DRAFT_1356385 [Lactifluus volemus]|nr:hypothetical protein BGW80DRAFT_1356385 [Lactifluus volemus]